MNRLGSLFRRKSEPTQFSAPEEDEQSIARVVSADYLAVHGSREDAAHGECIRQSSVGCETDPLMDSSSSSSCSQDEIHKNTHADGFGDKSISMFGGFCLLANNITGPAMVNIPVVYQQAGWLPCTIGMIVVMTVAGFSATMMCKAMSMVPGNDRFQGRIELAGLARHYFPKWGYYLTLLLLVVSLQATNIASIIISSQTADFAFIAIFKWVGGVEIYPHPGWVTADSAGDSNSPFGSVVILSIGFVVILLTAIPLGYFNLDDNIYIQVVAFFSMIIIVMGVWTADCFMIGLEFDRVRVVNSNQTQLLGVIIFNFAFVTSVPSWVNEKKEKISVNRSIWSSTVISTFIFIWMGFLCGYAFYYLDNNNVLDVINDQTSGRVMQILADVSVYAFPEVVLVSSIPVFSIIVRYNILESGLMGKHWANVFSVLLPWIIAVPFYTGSGLNEILSWTGLVVNGVINFVIPLLLYIAALRRYPTSDRPRELTIEERTRTASFINQNIIINNTESGEDSCSSGEYIVTSRGECVSAREADNRYVFKTFHAVPLWLQDRFGVSPLWVAAILALLITIGVIATVILDFVYLGLGQNLVS